MENAADDSQDDLPDFWNNATQELPQVIWKQIYLLNLLHHLACQAPEFSQNYMQNHRIGLSLHEQFKMFKGEMLTLRKVT